MPVNADLRRELFSLSPEERQDLAEELYESVVGDVDPDWETAWSDEIAQRISDAGQKPDELLDAHQMIRDLRAELGDKRR